MTGSVEVATVVGGPDEWIRPEATAAPGGGMLTMEPWRGLALPCPGPYASVGLRFYGTLTCGPRAGQGLRRSGGRVPPQPPRVPGHPPGGLGGGQVRPPPGLPLSACRKAGPGIRE